MPDPLPRTYVLAEGEEAGEFVIGINQPARMNIVVNDYCDGSDVEDIKHGINGKALYCWGLVTYKDVFGDSHFTRFCQRLTFGFENKVDGQYTPGRNESD